MGEIILSPTIDALIQILKSVSEEIKFVWGVDAELNSLVNSLSVIESVLLDAERKQLVSNSVKNWLLQLKNVAHDAEDIIEEFIVGALETKTEDGDDSNKRVEVPKQQKGAESRKRKKVLLKLFLPCFKSKNAVYQHDVVYKLRSLRKRVGQIEKECRGLRLIVAREEALMQANDEQLQNSLKADSLILGREEEKNKLLEELLSEKFSGRGPSVIPIVAPGGIGKTTFARLAFNCKEVEQHFKHRWWFCVSPDLNEEKITREILTSTTGYYLGDIEDKLRFKKLLRNSRFLLVLDNIRDDNPNWKKLLVPFTAGHKQSKIIITTRSEEIGSILGTAQPYRLEGLSDDDCSKLFFVKALDAESFQRHPNLGEIGEKIVNKCRGSPLAAKTLGGLLLNNRQENEWVNILGSSTWNITETNNDVLPALKICYQQLPASSKMCFRYCSLFPRDYLFQETELVELWIGEGYIRQMDQANQVFYDFLIKSFFSVDSVWSGKPIFKMHDMVHELAVVSNEEIVRMEEGKPNVIPVGTRHSSLVCFNEVPSVSFEELCKGNSLRSFLYLDLYHDKRLPEENGGGIFPNQKLDLLLQCKFLRVLRLQGCMIERLPESISSLKLLRLLDLSYTPLRILPNSIGKLYNLQILNLRNCTHITELPKDITKLIYLRFLYLELCISLPSDAIAHVGNLRNLQTLPRFVVSRETGHRISELKDMSDLKGNIVIFSLENVASEEEAKEANMKKKPYITDLTLQWSPMFLSGDRDASGDEKVLDSLEPHSNLKHLSLVGYQGRRSPSWLKNLTSLQRLELNSCPKLASLPENGLPNSLQLLKIIWCPLLEERCKKETGEDWPKIAHIPKVIV
ncbi:putative disease resistance protein RGA3 [Aristolochia californica]|uniref:putative disease resistance protein RGA3 n=1 Tax=Aristolochia californica TaxID=171875 RepID=UPI0035D8773B